MLQKKPLVSNSEFPLKRKLAIVKIFTRVAWSQRDLEVAFAPVHVV